MRSRICLVAAGIGCAAAASAAADDRQRVELIERVSRSVVHIKAERQPPGAPQARTPDRRSGADRKLDEIVAALDRRPRPEEASGFVLDSDRGLVLTAAHVVARASAVTVELPDGTVTQAHVAGVDEEGGVALLRIAPKLPALPLSQHEPKAGESALIVGWMIPLRSIMPIEGMVMGKAPGMEASPEAPVFANYVALDAVLPNGGFGGSPAVDASGNVVGLVSAIYGRGYGPGSLTMIIPTASWARSVEELASKGRVARAGIGITVECPSGNCSVQTVEHGSAAEAAGIRPGDAIVAVDGAKVASWPQVRRAIGAKPVGSPVAVALYREGRLSTITLVTAAGD